MWRGLTECQLSIGEAHAITCVAPITHRRLPRAPSREVDCIVFGVRIRERGRRGDRNWSGPFESGQSAWQCGASSPTNEAPFSSKDSHAGCGSKPKNRIENRPAGARNLCRSLPDLPHLRQHSNQHRIDFGGAAERRIKTPRQGPELPVTDILGRSLPIEWQDLELPLNRN